MAVELRKVALPDFGPLGSQPQVPASTYEARAKTAYERAGCDWLAVYADREHFGNIVFLTGFEPRFEEAFLLLGPKGERILLTGNESESYASLAGLPGLTVLMAQSLSLMGQDRTRHPRLADRLRDAGLRTGDSVGLVGWKYLEPQEDDEPQGAFFVPAVHVRMFERLVGPAGTLRDVTSILMHPETGLRAVIDADQIAAFEWASTRVSLALWRIVSGVREGDDEFSAAARMNYAGDPLNVHTMLASAGPGETVIGLRGPIGRKFSRGDGVTSAIGYWGALSSRAGLFDTGNEAFQKTASAYFEGLLAWYETADIGVTGGSLYEAVVGKLEEGGLRSALNPGHLTGHEEWMHSPVRLGSAEKLASGMPFQVDVIPVPMPAGWTLNCEDPVTFADQGLRDELKSRHPECFARIKARRAFMRDELGVEVRENILPLSSTPLCLPPFWLKPDHLLART
ncbi:Xaa-Pro aminopeptidase [Mesorhizobium sp. IMUNJ 23232]|uniref:Xaa-Pro aminopeptidase n=1 Tax=Mesorhizobium sp. IMUNJ 23232 TaxID=3376064 RepID=UPI0037B3C2DF